MRVLLSTHGSLGDLPPRAAEVVAARFDTVAAAAEEGAGPVATGVLSIGGWR